VERNSAATVLSRTRQRVKIPWGRNLIVHLLMMIMVVNWKQTIAGNPSSGKVLVDDA
jgi:hypothetical protein